VFNDEMLTIEQVAEYLKLKPQTIYKWAQSGKIPGAKFGKEWRFRRSLLEEWIDKQLSSSGNSNERPSTRERGGSTRAQDKAASKKKAAGSRNPDSGATKN